MSKLPEGEPVYIREYDDGYVAVDNRIPLSREANGTAMTYADRLERDKAIAREAFEAARQSHGKLSAENGWEYDFESADEYLQSEEFKELTK